MKRFYYIIIIFVFSVSCNTEEFKPLSINAEIAKHLNEEGYPSILTHDDKIIISGASSRVDLLLKINQIYNKMEMPWLQFKIEKETSGVRVEEVICSSGPIYDSGSDAFCQNFLCIGTDGDLKNLGDCFDGTCFTLSTICVNR